MKKLTEKQLHILQHSLGVDKYGQGKQYRNNFVTDPSSDDGVACGELCKLGYMKTHGPQALAGGMHYFCVTPQGVDAVALQSPAPPKVSRSRQRYLDFLHADSGMTFKEWLLYQPERKRRGYV